MWAILSSYTTIKNSKVKSKLNRCNSIKTNIWEGLEKFCQCCPLEGYKTNTCKRNIPYTNITTLYSFFNTYEKLHSYVNITLNILLKRYIIWPYSNCYHSKYTAIIHTHRRFLENTVHIYLMIWEILFAAFGILLLFLWTFCLLSKWESL